ncbi:MAG: lamin tail domain-containing protein [bacterium]|nr:lamin tail domain-containing protein [bacterium]
MARMPIHRTPLTILCVLLSAASAEAELLINELAPDPAGADTGREFVEIINASSISEDMTGVMLQFANGSEGAVWRTRWEAEPGLLLAPGTRFLLADRNWQGPGQAQVEVWLGLQNGPDALRLVRGDSVLDLVGWGALTDPELMEATPAPSAPGAALSRRPDGWDSQDNGADFVVADPTPGWSNFRPWALSVLTVAMDPPSLARIGDPLLLDVEVRNDGLEDWPVTTLILAAGQERGTALLDACPAGDVRRFSWQVRPGESGRVALGAVAVAPGNGDTIVLDLGAVHVGAGALFLSEIMAAPRRDEGEWIEIEAVMPGDLGGWRLRDEGGEWRDLPVRTLAAGERILLAQEPVALEEWILEARARGGFAACDGPVPAALELAGWPNLNNTAPDGRAFAERLQLADPTGLVVDHATIGGLDGKAPDGLSWERVGIEPAHPTGANWGTCTARTGATPGCPNSLSTPGTAGPTLTVEPAVLDGAAGPGAVHLRFQLIAGETGWRARLHDLWGAPVRDFGGDDLGTGPRDLVWDGRDDRGMVLPPGGYVALLLVKGGAGGTLRRERVVVVVR